MKKILILCLLSFAAKAQTETLPIIAIFGTSLEYGMGCTDYQTDPWPYKFKLRTNGKYQVKNYGIIGATYCQSSNPITLTKGKVQEAMIIILGGPTNDAAFIHQTQANLNFKSRYQANIDSIRVWNPQATIYCNTAIKVGLNSYISQANIDLRNQEVRAIAALNNITVWSADQLPLIVGPDGIHCQTYGYGIMADFFYKEFTSVIPTTKPIDIVEPVNEDMVIPIFQGLYLEIRGNRRILRRK